jgi:GntR family transcriptional regulator, rspAB operon transcriptional repressor
MTTIGAQHRSLRDNAVDELRRLILDGELAAGSRLTEAATSERLGVSRVPVREAFRRLEAEGLLQSHPRRGVTVTGLDPVELTVVREVRTALELMAVRHVVERRDPSTTAVFSRLLDAGNAANDRHDFDALDEVNEQFHDAIGRGSGSRFLADSLRSARNQARHLVGGKSAAVDHSWDEHARVIDAILAEDAEYATFLMRRHLEARHENQGGSLRWPSGGDTSHTAQESSPNG